MDGLINCMIISYTSFKKYYSETIDNTILKIPGIYSPISLLALVDRSVVFFSLIPKGFAADPIISRYQNCLTVNSKPKRKSYRRIIIKG